MGDKFKTLVHDICHRMSDDPARLGQTKLNKILWYSDVLMFKRRGAPITDTRYIKGAPTVCSFTAVLDQLHCDAIVVQRRETYPGGTHTKFFSIQEPDITGFAPEEISLFYLLINEVCYEHTAKSISDLSYGIAWKMHEIGEEMPLYRSHVMRLGQGHRWGYRMGQDVGIVLRTVVLSPRHNFPSMDALAPSSEAEKSAMLWWTS